MKLLNLFLFNSIWIFHTSIAGAAACCGGGFAVPSIISGDDRAQVTTSLTNSVADSYVTPNGIWYKRQAQESTQTLKIDAAHIWNDRYQFGLSIPILRRTKEGVGKGESSALGDVSLQGGYEYLPDWDYHPWRPRGVGFLSLTLPTGKTADGIEDAENYGLDTTGRGFWTLGAGTLFTKSWISWDANINMEIHHGLDKNVKSSQMQGTLKPGWGGSAGFGIGYNIGNSRWGGSLSWSQEDPMDVLLGPRLLREANKGWPTASLVFNHLFPEQWAGSLSISDQTLIGDPTNTDLNKSVSITIQKRWMR